ncbi:30S ribosomal protein S3 [endosymbiont of Acanthamoeba sp. UWC8]|nr:30S ribosomal protein S3 [Candidatus Jidaibacter acanthamoeba]AIF81727.1 30S ribosomal protein S3 [endosymbiont of Acanthamoeba sp. UWC8]
MGQKVNPLGLRLGIIRTWDSLWYAKKDYADKLLQDLKIKEQVEKNLAHAGVCNVKIERPANKTRVIIYASRLAVIIGNKGSGIEKIKKDIEKITNNEVSINVVEERKPETNAILIAQSIAQQLVKRAAFRKVAKRAVQTAMRMGAKGIRVNVSGRLGGAEIARTEWYREGRVPLHTLRADVDYGIARANTTYGVIGIKVWVYKGDKIEKQKEERNTNTAG